MSMIADELNVLSVNVLTAHAEEYVSYKVKPNFRTLGQKGLGKQAQALKKSMGAMSAAEAQTLVQDLLASGKVKLQGIELDKDDVEVAFDAKEGYAAAGDRVGVVVLDTRLDDTLRDLGYLRELLSRVQNARKDMGLDFVDRIHIEVSGTDRTKRVVSAHEKTILSECLAVDLRWSDDLRSGPPSANSPKDAWKRTDAREVDVEGDTVRLAITRA